VFVWFGALKVFGVSPVTSMLRETYTFLALPGLTVLLGIWEMLIGFGLMSKLALRQTLYLMCLHLAGTFVALWLAPSHFFLHGNPLVLTADGEFVVKNLVLLTAGLVIGANESSRVTKRVVQAPVKPSERTN
jgi:putative oxidoreductase